MSSEKSFYAVGHGKKPGVYEKWSEVQEQIKDYPQPVYKKFGTKEEAEEYVQARRPARVSFDVDEEADKFYAIARGNVIGVFTDYSEVKGHIADYPQPLFKKFEKLEDAKAYFKKYSDGENGSHMQESNNSETKSKSNEKEVKESEKDAENKEEQEEAVTFYGVACGRETGVFKTLEECEKATKDFKNAKFKRFDNEHDAKAFVEGKVEKKAADDRKRRHAVVDDTKDDDVKVKVSKEDNETVSA